MNAKWNHEMACWTWSCAFGCFGWDCESQFEAEQEFLKHACPMSC